MHKERASQVGHGIIHGARFIACGSQSGTLYCLLGCPLPCRLFVHAKAENGLGVWHRRLAHMSQKVLEVLSSSQKLTIIAIADCFIFYYVKFQKL
jgi:hypothetical protein